jgi:hypothetical protein
MTSLEDRIFFNFKEAIDAYLRMEFEFIENKRLIRNDLEVIVRSIGTNIWRCSIITRTDYANEYKTNP